MLAIDEPRRRQSLGAERAPMVGEDHINFKLVARISLRRFTWGYEALPKVHGATVDVVGREHRPLLTLASVNK